MIGDLANVENLEVVTLAGAMHEGQEAGLLSVSTNVVRGALLVNITDSKGNDAGVFLTRAMLDEHIAHCLALRDRL